MYFQLFIRKPAGKLKQYSVDSFEELNEFVEDKRPKFFIIEGYDAQGLRAVNHYYWNFMQDCPILHRRAFRRPNRKPIPVL